MLLTFEFDLGFSVLIIGTPEKDEVVGSASGLVGRRSSFGDGVAVSETEGFARVEYLKEPNVSILHLGADAEAEIGGLVDFEEHRNSRIFGVEIEVEIELHIFASWREVGYRKCGTWRGRRGSRDLGLDFGVRKFWHQILG